MADLLIAVVATDADDLYRVAGLVLAVPGVERTAMSVAMHEVGAYRTRPLLEQLVDEFATLVNNPGSCREARDKHQINDDDLIDAPSTGDALREAFAFMAGTVLVAHNFDFEEGFLSAAARESASPSPRCSVCAHCRRRDANSTAARTASPSCTRQPLENSRPTSTPDSVTREPSAKSFSGCWPTHQRLCISCTPHPVQSQPHTPSSAKLVVGQCH